ncbi:ArnT family glycosyltransferase [Roseateles amylovorans]|uniref:Glycosyltransferase family 39 protein n=1 Tax=Roseateles amylovorans TaxID=2978473 RepID=A0ABY6AYT1_9BURK|nr:glycosyltransferase family 39 protein [Roseateles amylovorans]UXH76235.1 glycosyltransferase family 39 protein [Roseateles amylovorans]
MTLTLIWLAATAWARPLMLPDEGRYVGVAWEALRSGQWLVPTLNGLPFFHKPPLFYWITEVAMSLLGVNVFSARAAPMLGGAAGALSLFWLIYRWRGAAQARAALVSLLAMPLFFLGAQFANLDMLVAGCISATIVLAVDASLRMEHGLAYRRPLTAAFAMAGAGILAKGLIGAVLPGLVLLLWLVVRRQWRVIGALLWWPGLLLMLAIAMPWFVLMQQRYPDFLHYFFVVQHFQRFAAGGFNNVQPVWFYGVVLPLVSLPALPWLYRGWRGRLRPLAPDVHSLDGLMAIWWVVVVAFFSLPQSKLVGYILPAVPPMAGLVAAAWCRLLPVDFRTRTWAGVSLAAGVLIGLAAVTAYALGAGRTHRDLARQLAAQRSADEPVVMLERFDYDVPFYARLTTPMWVVEDWNDADLMARDNWRKELGDTRLFAPPGQGDANFLTRASLLPALCAHPGAWLVGGEHLAQELPWLRGATLITQQGGSTLWHVRRADLDCRWTGAAP